MVVDQYLGTIVNRFDIFWSPLGVLLTQATRTIVVAAKLHSFIIDHRVYDGVFHVHIYDLND